MSLQARLCPLRGMKSAFLMYQHNYPTGAKLNVNKPDSALYMETFPEDDRTSGTNKNHVQQNFPSCTITASIWGTTNNESERNMWKPIDHFGVPLCLCFKASLSAKPFLWSDFDLHEKETACRTHFHMKGFALRLALKLRHKRTRKWPIQFDNKKGNDLFALWRNILQRCERRMKVVSQNDEKNKLITLRSIVYQLY